MRHRRSALRTPLGPWPPAGNPRGFSPSLFDAAACWNLQRVDSGFTADHLLRADLLLPQARYPRDFSVFPNWTEVHAFNREVLAAIEALPGVRSAALASNHPLLRHRRPTAGPGPGGVYGLLSYVVAQRRHEVGVRMVLGAAGADVVGLIVRQGMALAGLGLAVGIAGALAAVRLLDSLLFGVSSTDPLAYGTVVLVLGGASLAACLLPARRAARIDPMASLRGE